MVDVVLLRLRVRSGWPRLVMGLLVRIFRLEQRIMNEGGTIGETFRNWVNAQFEPILVNEGMYTESAFLGREDDDICLFWYMEADDVEAVYEAFDASDHPVTSERAIGWFFENPEKVLTADVESDYPLLLHAWHPDRP
ncbi:DUF6176 family protein [Halalkalicoccus tibetensis]|uniref:DUF6176 family protein n=1 Tax=Halalkalicoccus tibetensis TaxID=175632 RepID=A0ABD5UZK3_9EURY